VNSLNLFLEKVQQKSYKDGSISPFVRFKMKLKAQLQLIDIVLAKSILFKRDRKKERKRKATRDNRKKKNCISPESKPLPLRNLTPYAYHLKRGGRKVRFILQFLLQLPNPTSG